MITGISLALRGWKSVGFRCLQPTNEAGRRGVNFLMSEEGRSQSHSWRVVAPGRARRPSVSEVNDFGPWQAARARWETSQVPRAPAAPRVVAALLGLALYCVLSYLNRKRQFRERISLSRCSGLSIVQLSSPGFIPWV